MKREMKPKWVVMETKWDKEVERFDTESQAVEFVQKGPPADLMGDVEWYIRKIWTNRKD